MQTEMGATASTFMGKTEAKMKPSGIEKALMKTPKVTKLDPNESGDPTTIGIGSEQKLVLSGTGILEPQEKENVESESSLKPQSTHANVTKVSTKSQNNNQNSGTDSRDN